ncbi:MAG: translation initiation factor aIF-1A [Sulfolobales archaeon]
MSKKKEKAAASSELLLPSEGQVVCVVTEIIGADWVKMLCADGVERMGRIPGKFRRKVWIAPGDLVLAAPWDYQKNKADVLYRYEKDERKRIIEMGYISKEILDLVS